MGREKPPSKDGAAQRAAGEVAGLKDYVRHLHLSSKEQDKFIIIAPFGFLWWLRHEMEAQNIPRASLPNH